MSNGYYPQLKTQSCSRAGGEVKFDNTVSKLGENSACTYLGRVIEFSDGDSMKIFSIAGLRVTPGGDEPVTMAEAKPKAITSNIEQIALKNRIRVHSVKIAGSGNYGAVGFFTSLGTKKANNLLQSGALNTNFIALDPQLNGPGSDDTPNLMVSNGFRTTFESSPNNNPEAGIEICINSGTNNEHAILTIGGNNNTSSTSVVVSGGVC